MSVKANNLFVDGTQVVTKGVNSSVAPNTLPSDQLAWLVNGTTRTDFPAQRPGWKRRPLTGETIATGLFQGAALFQRRSQIVLSVSGSIYAIDLNNYGVTAITTGSTGTLPRNPNYHRRAWFCEAEEFLIVQDNQSAALLYTGGSARRANPARLEVPTGNVMAYALGRLWVTLPDGYSYVGSDLVYSSTGTASYQRRDAILRFTENTLYAGGGAFGIPFRSGKITAMVPIGQIDTSLGQGPLQVFTEQGVFSVNAPFDRTQWQTVNFPIQSSSLLGNGATSDWAATNVNGDIWYRSFDGIRSFQVARRNFGAWVNTSLSEEVTRAIGGDTRDLLSWCSNALFDNRLLTTCAPYVDYDYGMVWRGLAVLDFHPANTMLEQRAPVWDGQWSGLNILQIISGIVDGLERCFALVLGAANDVQLWELTTDYMFDNDGDDDELITWQLETRSYNWGGGWNLRKLEFGDVWYDQLDEDCAFTVYHRPDQEPNWQQWHSWQSCATSQECSNTVGDTGCGPVPATLSAQYRVRKRFPSPLDGCDIITGKPYNRGFEFQVKLIVQGPCRIKKLRLLAGDVPEETVGACENDNVCRELAACLPDTLDYSIVNAPDRV